MRVVAGVVFRAGGYGAAVGIAPGCEGGALFNAFEQCAIAMKSKAQAVVVEETCSEIGGIGLAGQLIPGKPNLR